MSGLRDRKATRVRDRTLGVRSPSEGHELAAQMRGRLADLARRSYARVRAIDLPTLDLEARFPRGEDDHFVETMLGGIAITIGILVATIVVVWAWYMI